jgi:hypothetical protein
VRFYKKASFTIHREEIRGGDMSVEHHGGPMSESTTAFSRDNEGSVNIGEVNIKIPQGHMALGIIGCSSNRPAITDGAELKSDGWVYVEGKKTRRWFQSKRGIERLWEPHTAYMEISKLEASRWKRWNWVRERNKPHWNYIIRELLNFGGGVRGMRYAPGEKKEHEAYWDCNPEGESYSWGWVSDRNREFYKDFSFNQELFDSLLYADKIHDTNYRRYWVIKEYFELAIESYYHKFLSKTKEIGDARMILFKINEREYWFDFSKNIKRISYPEDTTTIVVKE